MEHTRQIRYVYIRVGRFLLLAKNPTFEMNTFNTLFSSVLKDVAGIPTSFEQEFSRENLKKGHERRKIREVCLHSR